MKKRATLKMWLDGFCCSLKMIISVTALWECVITETSPITRLFEFCGLFFMSCIQDAKETSMVAKWKRGILKDQMPAESVISAASVSISKQQWHSNTFQGDVSWLGTCKCFHLIFFCLYVFTKSLNVINKVLHSVQQNWNPQTSETRDAKTADKTTWLMWLKDQEWTQVLFNFIFSLQGAA